MKEIVLGHGGGGQLSRDLVNKEIITRFGNSTLSKLTDAAPLHLETTNIAYTTDSFVVNPLFFPGGNIGDLSVNGTLNDLLVSGARPIFLSLGLIIEEGLSLKDLRLVLDSIKKASEENNVQIVAGDTKVVERGRGDGIYINTSGIGTCWSEFNLDVNQINPGDKIIVNGSIGDHGISVMAAREKLDIKNPPKSDTASVLPLVESIVECGSEVRFMRDVTRGGLAAVLNEIVENQDYGALLFEDRLPVKGDVMSVSETLGIDLFHVACEGRLISICSPEVANEIVSRWRNHPVGADAIVIGEISEKPGKVVLETLAGGNRLIGFPQGELLPRIC